MITQLHHHIGGFGMAMGLPIADTIDQLIASARVLHAAAEKTSHAEDFGSQIAQAVRRKTARSQGAVFAATPRKNDDDDSEKDADAFGDCIKKAIERKSRHMKTQTQHKEQADRERKRYQQPQQRPHTKSD